MSLRRLKIPLILLGVVGVAFGALAVIVPAMVDTDPIIETLQKEVEAMTGRPLVVGKVSVSVLPSAAITVDGVAIRNDDVSSKNHFLRAQKLVIRFSLLKALMGEKVQAADIELVAPHIELERFNDGTANWQFLDTTKKATSTQGSIRLRILGGTASFTHHQQDYFETLNGLDGDLNLTPSNLSLSLSAVLRRQPVRFSATCAVHQFRHLSSYDMDCTSSTQQESNSLGYKGRLVNKEGALTSRGSLTLKAADARNWIDLALGKGKSPFAGYYTQTLPLQVTADVFVDPTRAVVNLGQLISQDTSGKGSLTADFTKDEATWVTNLWFDKLQLDQLRPKFKGKEEADIFALDTGFPKNIAVQATLQAKSMTFHEVAFSDVVGKAELVDGDIIVSNMTMKTPAEGNLITLGRMVSKADGLEYDGQVEAYGESLRALGPLLGIALEDIPESAFGQFRARFNLIARPTFTTISELRLVTGDRVQLAGGINLQHGGSRRVDATIGLRYFDFAPFEELWLKKHHLFQNPAETPGHPFGFEWLKSLNKNINLTVKLADYTLFGMPGGATEMSIAISPNTISVTGLNGTWGGSRLNGRISLRHLPERPRPFISSQLTISALKLGDTFLDTMLASNDEQMLHKTMWSRGKRIIFWPLHYFDGEAELRIRRIEHARFQLYNLRGMVRLEDYRLEAKDVQFSLWGAPVQANISVDSEVVPGFDISFGLQNGQIKELLASFVDYSNIGGTVSMSGKVSFTGLNYHDWIKDIRGYITLDARNIFIQEFNLPAIVRAISTVRAVSGLANSVRLAQDKGSSRIDNVNGTVTLGAGRLDVPKLTLRANESVGEINGSLDLQQWLMRISVKLGLITLAQTGYPFLNANLAGSISQPELRLDTSEVEAYLAREIRR